LGRKRDFLRGIFGGLERVEGQDVVKFDKIAGNSGKLQEVHWRRSQITSII